MLLFLPEQVLSDETEWQTLLPLPGEPTRLQVKQRGYLLRLKAAGLDINPDNLPKNQRSDGRWYVAGNRLS